MSPSKYPITYWAGYFAFGGFFNNRVIIIQFLNISPVSDQIFWKFAGVIEIPDRNSF